MICALCEHPQQAGTECEVCGWRRTDAAALLVEPIEPIEGLERTVIEIAAAAPPAGGEVLEALEPNRLEAPPGDPPATGASDSAAWLEPTRADAVVVADFAVLEVERVSAGRPAPGAPGPLVCRYCRTPAAPGAFCGRCGMKVTGHRPPQDAVDEPALRCRACGALLAGSTCPGCGWRPRSEES